MTISEEILRKASSEYNEIIYSKFVQKMKLGTLEPEKFAYYINQDVVFLVYYAKCNAYITKHIAYKYKADFAIYTKNTAVCAKFDAKYLADYPEYQTNSTTRATEGYTGHLVKNCVGLLENCLAAILACEMLYKDLGEYLKNNTVANNPYEPWFMSLVAPEYVEGVNDLVGIVDSYGATATNVTQARMIDIGVKGYVWEHEFFQDSYVQQVFNDY